MAYIATFAATGTDCNRETDSNGKDFVRYTQHAMPGAKLLTKFYQYYEMRADLESAKLAGTASGAIAFLKKNLNKDNDLKFESPK